MLLRLDLRWYAKREKCCVNGDERRGGGSALRPSPQQLAETHTLFLTFFASSSLPPLSLSTSSLSLSFSRLTLLTASASAPTSASGARDAANIEPSAFTIMERASARISSPGIGPLEGGGILGIELDGLLKRGWKNAEAVGRRGGRGGG